MTAALIVEDGGSPYVLAAVRSLGRAGFRVSVASPVPNPRVVPSRYLDRWHRTRLPEDDLDGFVADVRGCVHEGGYELIFGADDIELLALSARRAEIPAVLPHAPHNAVLRAVDKLTLAETAAAVGERAGAGTAARSHHRQGPLALDARRATRRRPAPARAALRGRRVRSRAGAGAGFRTRSRGPAGAGAR